MPHLDALVTLTVLGLILASSWSGYLALRREREKLRGLYALWNRASAPVFPGSLVTWCQDACALLGVEGCSLWVAQDEIRPFVKLADQAGGRCSYHQQLIQALELGGPAGAGAPWKNLVKEVPLHEGSRTFEAGGHWWKVWELAPGGMVVGALLLCGPSSRLPTRLSPWPTRLSPWPTHPSPWPASLTGQEQALVCVAALLALRMVRDFELTRTRQQLDSARAELFEERRLAAVGRLAAGVAHELNTPLGAVLTMVGSVSRKVQDPDLTRRLDIMREGIVRCRSIIEKLLVFSRDGGKEEDGLSFTRYAREATRIDQVVQRALALLAEDLENDAITLKSDLASGLEAEVNPTQWEQIVTNLVSNARNALQGQSDPAPVIEVRLARVDNALRLTVSDNGPGVPEAIRPHIFDPFFTTREIGQGTGLGLALVREMVKKHGGSVELLNQPQAGAHFCVTLPLPTVSAASSST